MELVETRLLTPLLPQLPEGSPQIQKRLCPAVPSEWREKEAERKPELTLATPHCALLGHCHGQLSEFSKCFPIDTHTGKDRIEPDSCSLPQTAPPITETLFKRDHWSYLFLPKEAGSLPDRINSEPPGTGLAAGAKVQAQQRIYPHNQVNISLL